MINPLFILLLEKTNINNSLSFACLSHILKFILIKKKHFCYEFSWNIRGL